MKSGAIKLNPLHRWLRRTFVRRHHLAGDLGVNWSQPFDIRDKVGAITIKSQGDNYSCGGQAGSYFLEIQRRLQSVKETDISAKSIYSRIAYPGGGTTVAALESQIGMDGANLEVDVPSYDANGLPLPEYYMTSRVWETPALDTDALTRGGYLPINVPVDIESVADAISVYGAVILECHFQNNGTNTSAYPNPPSKSNPNPVWTHFICAIGYKMVNNVKYITFLQSAGTSWGDQGIQYLSEDFFNGAVIDAVSFLYDTKIVPLLSNNSIWAAVVRWFRFHWGLPV